ncbi:hypothetical protein GGD81_004095 [Rhodobium orientis]|uniref:DUF927 domain-containing protein n=1 Tax=Rhodobium orientis TaxID=34017 RepID=A0A327JK65_9HYPH|nr:DUF927 domain-containing protein [Rhodobium orientis]MBB4305029.1 hypothetical protein [Rhodobium orientis]MBK5948765.1 hypothetical protein [Rhodobium orientis]RAI26471.1 hypothetical protein CH339_14170 [Rhodobium orientis]
MSNKENEKAKDNPDELTIGKAAQTSRGEIFCEVVRGTRRLWIPVAELASDEKAVFCRISECVAPILTVSNRNALKKKIEAISEFENALVATQPGWVMPNVYVHPNGDVQSPDSFDQEVIATFEKDNCWGERGSFRKWKEALESTVSDNVFAQFLLNFGFTGPLIAKSPPNLLNPAIELVGPREIGKSTIATMVTSIYGGNKASEIGLGRSANLTKQALKPLQRTSADALLFLDELNLVDGSVENNLHLVFEHASSDERARYGDTARKKPVRNSLIMTGNRALADRCGASSEVIEAARSRFISLRFDGPILTRIPAKFKTSREAAEFLKARVRRHHGTAIGEFIGSLLKECEESDAAIRRRIKELMGTFRDRVPAEQIVSQRIVDMFALTYAAGVLVQEWRIVPKSFLDPMASTLAVYKHALEFEGIPPQGSYESPSIQRIRQILHKNRKRIKSVATTDRPKPLPQIHRTFGYRIQRTDGSEHFFLEPSRLKTALGTHATSTLKTLRAEGVLIGEAGAHKKLQSKAPLYVGFTGRVYKIVLSPRT